MQIWQFSSFVKQKKKRRRNRNADGNVDPEEESRRKLGGIWPHNMSPMFALLAATLGLFNVSRFALLSIEYGGNFIVQFMLLSFLFGIPLLCFHACLGQFLGSNVIDMWRISPIFKVFFNPTQPGGFPILKCQDVNLILSFSFFVGSRHRFAHRSGHQRNLQHCRSGLDVLLLPWFVHSPRGSLQMVEMLRTNTRLLTADQLLVQSGRNHSRLLPVRFNRFEWMNCGSVTFQKCSGLAFIVMDRRSFT